MVERLESIKPADIDLARCCFNPGCAMSMCKPELPEMTLSLLREHFGPVKMHRLCCQRPMPARGLCDNQ